MLRCSYRVLYSFLSHTGHYRLELSLCHSALSPSGQLSCLLQASCSLVLSCGLAFSVSSSRTGSRSLSFLISALPSYLSLLSEHQQHIVQTWVWTHVSRASVSDFNPVVGDTLWFGVCCIRKNKGSAGLWGKWPRFTGVQRNGTLGFRSPSD